MENLRIFRRYRLVSNELSLAEWSEDADALIIRSCLWSAL